MLGIDIEMMKDHSPLKDPEVLGKALYRPSSDLGDILGALGIKLFSRERTLVQYVSWSLDAGIFELLDDAGRATVEDVEARSHLTVAGADALLGILCALRLVERAQDASYALAAAGREYFLRASPYFIGDELEPIGYPIPDPYIKRRGGKLARWKFRYVALAKIFQYGTQVRLQNQHARNLAASVAAVETGAFDESRCIVDLGGGSGVLAIPLLARKPQVRLVLAELPQALENIRSILRSHRLEASVSLLALNMLEFPWALPPCDSIFIGNVLHGFSDEMVSRMCGEAFRCLPSGGKIWLHEMVWNDRRDGPLVVALWHAAMLSAGPGKQRTAMEWEAVLREAGFQKVANVQTASPFSLISATKP